jgi:hypothetical protein
MPELRKIITLIDFDEKAGQWLAICGSPDCPNTGEFARSDGSTPEEHDMVWLTGVRHEEHFHDGDGQLDYDALISVRPYPVPRVTRG